MKVVNICMPVYVYFFLPIIEHVYNAAEDEMLRWHHQLNGHEFG